MKTSPLFNKLRESMVGLFLLILLGILLAVPQSSLAQNAESNGGDSPSVATQKPPAHLENPRETMRSFMRGVIDAAEFDLAGREAESEAALTKAISTLDLSDINVASRDAKGRELALLLKNDVFDKIERVDYNDIPTEPEDGVFVFFEDSAGIIAIAKSEDGAWRFSKDTVASIRSLSQALQKRASVEGIVRTGELEPIFKKIERQLPPFLTDAGVIMKWWQWLGIGVLLLIGLIIGRIGVIIILNVLSRQLRRIHVQIEDAERQRLVLPITYVITAIVWWIFNSWLGLDLGVQEFTDDCAVILFGVGMILTALRITNITAVRLTDWAAGTESKYDDLLVPFVRKVTKALIVIIGTFTVLEQLDLDLTSALAGLGIGGLAIALAAQDTVRNVFGSITVIGDRPFKIGDWVVIGDVEGMVESLGFRSTRIRTFYNSLVTLPNANLISATVDNYGERTYRRYVTTLSVTYNTPPERLDAFCEGVRQLILEYPYTRKDYYHVYFHTYGAHSLDIMVYMFFLVPDWSTELRERHRFNMDILRLATRLGVEFAFPTQTLYLERGQGPAKPNDKAFQDVRAIDATLNQGRQTATELVRSTLGPSGTQPPPVTFDIPVGEKVAKGGDAGE